MDPDSSLYKALSISSYQPIQQSMNVIIRKDLTKTKLAGYLHKCAFSPCLSTFLKAIRLGHFQSWSGIDLVNFKNIIKNLVPTAKGHLDPKKNPIYTTTRR